MDFPNVLVLRGNSRQQSERYGRTWSKTLGMFGLRGPTIET